MTHLSAHILLGESDRPPDEALSKANAVIVAAIAKRGLTERSRRERVFTESSHGRHKRVFVLDVFADQ